MKANNTAVGSIDSLANALRAQRYIADEGLVTSIYLAIRLGRPLFLEGEAGVGKTEVAKALRDILQTDLIRLQCYEGLDVNQAVEAVRLVLKKTISNPGGARNGVSQLSLGLDLSGAWKISWICTPSLINQPFQ